MLNRLVADPGLRATLGARGREYVDSHFRWPVLVSRYERFLNSVVERGRGVPGVF